MRKLINVNEITEYSYFNPKHDLFTNLHKPYHFHKVNDSLKGI